MENTETLLVLTPGFPRDEEDSTCLPTLQLFIKVLNRCFPRLNIIILSFQYPYESSNYSWHRNSVVALGGKDLGQPRRFFLWFKAWNKMEELSKECKLIGLLSFWCGECALIGKHFAKIHRLLHYTWIQGQDAKKGNRYVKWIRPEANGLIAMSDFLAKEFFQNYGIRPAHIIPNGVDIIKRNGEASNREIDVLGVGSLIPLKQYDLFIQLIAELKNEIPALKCTICGKGPEEKRLRALIKKLGVEDVIHLNGEMTHPEVIRLMNSSRILLHPSSYEGFGLVCLEALQAGAQVVSFIKPMDEWIRHWHVATNKEEMLEILREILTDPAVEYRPVLPYVMDESAREVMRLFNYREQAIS